MRVNHRWRVTGREFHTPVPNIWTCSHCGLVRAEDHSRRRKPIEFSDGRGEVLSENGKKIPTCGEGRYR